MDNLDIEFDENSTEVLIIAYYFPPMGLSGVQRIVKFCKFLPQFGLKPIVLTHTPSDYYAFDESLLAEMEEAGITIYRTPGKSKKSKDKPYLPPYWIQNFGRKILQTIFQPDSKVLWKKKALKLADEIIKKHNIKAVLATAPPYTDFLIANEIFNKYGIPYLVDYRDTWVDNKFHFFATPFHKKYAIELENNIVKNANHIIVISRYAKELLLRRYKFIKHNRISIIPHGYDKEDFDNLTNLQYDKKLMTIVHNGIFQDDRSPKYMFKALKNLFQKQPNLRNYIRLNLVGMMRKNHLKMISKYGLTDVVVCKGNQSHTDSLKELMQADVLWVMLNDDIRTPGKFYEYIGTKKTMLITAPSGTITQIADESKAAICTEPKDVAAIEQAIVNLYNMWEANKLPKPDSSFVNKFERKQLTEDLSHKIYHSISDL